MKKALKASNSQGNSLFHVQHVHTSHRYPPSVGPEDAIREFESEEEDEEEISSFPKSVSLS